MTITNKPRTKLDTIPFSEIKAKNTLVMMGMTATKENIPHITNYLKGNGFLKSGTVINAQDITGNVLGTEGRNDILLTLENPEYNYPKRLLFEEVKWTEDFVTNYAEDYGVLELAE